MDEKQLFRDCARAVERNDRYLEMPIRDFSVTEFYKLIKKDNEVVGVYFDYENHLVSFIVNKKTGGSNEARNKQGCE